MNNFYIITGGPGSGKSSIIDELKSRGFVTVDEVGRQIIQEQIKINGDATHSKNQIKFRDLMLARSIDTYKAVTDLTNPVFFDRGIPELIGYSHLISANIPDELIKAVNLFRYNPNVFITPPWQEIYQHDTERKQSWEEAIETYERVAEAYRETGYQLVELPKCSVIERVEFILKLL